MSNMLQIRLNDMKKIVSAVYILTICLLVGCHPSKSVVTKPKRQDMDALKSLILEKPPVNVLTSKVNFWFSSKEGVNVSMKGSIKLKMDSCMILSLQFSGIELASCLIRPDSVVIISRLDKIYAAENLKNLPYSTSGLYSILGQVLTNRIFIPGKQEPREKDLNAFVWLKQKDGMKLNLNQRDYALSYLMDDNQQYTQMNLKMVDALNELTVNYSDFQETKTITFPNLVEINAKTNLEDNKTTTLKLKVTYLKPVFNSAVDFSFTIPPKYKKVTVKELFEQFDELL